MSDEYEERYKIVNELKISDQGIARAKKALESMQHEVLDDIEWSLKDDLVEWITDHIFEQYRRAVEAMLKGNEDAFRRAIQAEGYTGRERQTISFNGKLYESNGVALRRALAETNEAILRDEVVADLRAQKEALEQACIKLNQRLTEAMSVAGATFS